MSRKGAAVVFAGIITVAFAMLSSPAFSGEKPIKSLMAGNFSGMQHILISLITSNYQGLPAKLDVIREHANQLPDMIPESAENNEDAYLAYAHNLQTHSTYLKHMIVKLIERDARRAKVGQIEMDVLRDSAAAHYGGMVQMCVACHNRFRQHVVK